MNAVDPIKNLDDIRKMKTKKSPVITGLFLNGGINKPKLEPQQFIYKLKEAMCQDFIMQLKSLDLAA